MTIVEKVVTINEACNLFNEAVEKIRLAKKLCKKCGLTFCAGLDETENKTIYSCNLQLYEGINQLAHITGAVAEHPQDWYRTDKGVLRLEYKGLVFLQIGSSEETTFNFK